MTAPTVQTHPRQRVAPVAARALRTAREAHADRAHEPVLVQVQHDARPRRARSGERAPAERGLQVVGVHDTRTAQPHRRGNLVGLEAAAQQPDRGAHAAQAG